MSLIIQGSLYINFFWLKTVLETVTANLNNYLCLQSDHTEVNLIQTGVPTGELEVTKTNWERYYWEAMKQTFGFGVLLGDSF